MLLEQAKTLAHRIIDTWPAFAIKAHIWCDGLADLDYDQALGIYEHLRDHDERPPSVARFLAVYRSTTSNYGWQAPGDTGPPISLLEYVARHPDDTTLAALVGHDRDNESTSEMRIR